MKFLRLIPILFVSLSCQPHNESQGSRLLTYGSPHPVGMSADRLERIDNVLQLGVDSGYVKGIAGLIARNGKIVYHQSFGFTDEDNEKPLTKDAIFRIASQTKAITSVAAMMLFEEGKFLLDDPVSKYLKEFEDMKVLKTVDMSDSSYTALKAEKPITIRHLLTHTSGMSYFGFGVDSLRSIYHKNGLPSVFGSSKHHLSEFSEIAGGLPLLHEPGEKFSYGINTDILGRLVEVISGTSLNEFFQTRIFDPLGMNDTYFYLPDAKKDRLVPVFVREGRELIAIHGVDEYGVGLDYPLSEGTLYSGGAGLSSTLMDYAHFLQMLLNGGEYDGERLLSRRTVELMTSNQIGELMVGKDKFGLGFRVKTIEGQQELGETAGSISWGGYYGTIYWADPKERIIGLCFANQRKGIPGNLHNKFMAMTYAALDD